MTRLTRRNLCLGLIGVAAGPLPLRAQQPSLPVVGFLSSGSPRAFAKFLKAFQQGLSEAGFVEGRDVSIVYRWAEGHFDELDALAAELAARPVTLIAATGGMVSAQAAKKATQTIPIVTVLGFDPVKLGLVASFNKPGGNLTGTTIITTELAPKRLSLLCDLDPDIRTIASLVNPDSSGTKAETEILAAAASTTGRSLMVLSARSDSEIDGAFVEAAGKGVRGIVISADPLFTARRAHIVALAAKHRLPVMYPFREFAEAGGLMSYGPNLAGAYRVAGIYAGRILKGAKPSELPIEEPTAFEFIVNMKTAKALGLTIPPGLLSIVDDTIE
ncbi:MAG TPA: ABC transporter substrate-binding protein [Xanthobacteraceae bacterium]|jgi:putative ABC transport system substrate-binding protein